MTLTTLLDGPHARFSNGHVARPDMRGRSFKAYCRLTHAWHVRLIRPGGSIFTKSGFATSEAYARKNMEREVKYFPGSAISFAEVVPVTAE